MLRILRTGLGLLLLMLCLTNCRKKEWDAFYGRPESLAQPIYKVLQQRGNFTQLLACIDKAGYKDILNSAGYWTFFAPNDSAFFLWAKSGGSSVADMDSSSARAMVQYLLVYNSFKEDRLDDYQATKNDAGWTPDIAFRRRTAYYTGFYNDTTAGGRKVVAIANNRNSTGSLDGSYAPADHNNKYITYITSTYAQTNGLSASDYNYFFPNTPYTGFNVEQASVVNKDIDAENGVIDEIDHVITPPMSIDEYVRTQPEYSSFWAILNRLNVNSTVQFIYNATATSNYRILTGKPDSVFVKVYNSQLAFAPNNENFTKEEDNDGQQNCWTMFIPNNQAVDAFVKNVLCRYYKSLDDMPLSIIVDFLNAHMFPTVVWPTKFQVTHNGFGEPANFNPQSDVFDKKMLSNGIVYGTTKVEEPDVFSTVYGEAYLNPSFTMMTQLFNETGIKLLIANSKVSADVFLIPDSVFHNAGYSYNESKAQFEYRAPGSSSSTTNSVDDDLTRIVSSCVFYSPFKEIVDNLSGKGIVRSGDEGTEGEYMNYDNMTIQTAGLMDQGTVAHITATKQASNGTAYYLDKLPVFSKNDPAYHLKQLGSDASSPFNYFWQYLSNSTVYSPDETKIIGLTGFTTLFVPDNDAIVQAVNDGLLPGTGTAPAMVPNFNPSSVEDKELVRKFIQYHILDGHTAVPDGRSSGLYNTTLKNQVGDALTVSLSGSSGSLTISDNYMRQAHVIIDQSDHISNRCVIHLIDNYLKYSY